MPTLNIYIFHIVKSKKHEKMGRSHFIDWYFSKNNNLKKKAQQNIDAVIMNASMFVL